MPSSETVTATLGIRVARPLCRKKATTADHQNDGDQQGALDVGQRGADGQVRSSASCMSMSAGRAASSAGSALFTGPQSG